MEVYIATVEHRDQSYDTCGMWRWEPDETLTIAVSKLPDERFEFLVALHEFVEAYLCRAAGVSGEAVTAFDVAWEKKQQERSAASAGDFSGISEPGDDPDAPYREQHRFATLVEQLAAHELGVDWIAYSEAISALE